MVMMYAPPRLSPVQLLHSLYDYVALFPVILAARSENIRNSTQIC